MNLSPLLFAVAGASALLAAVLPRLLHDKPFSLPMAFLGFGVVLGAVPGLPAVDPMAHSTITKHVTEIVVIISLMGAGIALDRPVGWRRWMTTWRLLGVVMPVCIVLTALAGSLLAGLPLAAAVLLGAALAPTDPVLASDVQVGEPSDESAEDEVRFSLTSEAGLNDGAAFPVVHLALLLAAGVGSGWAWLGGWVLEDVVWRGGVGLLTGLLVGRLLAVLFFRLRIGGTRMADEVQGFTALAATFLAYGLAEVLHGYGFLAVFVAACTIRAAERSHGAHGIAHGFMEQVERMLTAWLLLLLGAAMADGLLRGLSWELALVAILLVVVIRPVAGVLGLLGTVAGPWERRVIGVFGVRGVGSLYYLSYALDEGEFPGEQLWAVVGFTVALSVVVHGLTATPAVARLDRARQERLAQSGHRNVSRINL